MILSPGLLLHSEGALLLFPFAAAGTYLLLRNTGVSRLLLGHTRLLAAALALAAALPVLVTVFGNLLTVPQQRPFGHDEVSLLSIAAAWRGGQPMYPAAGAAAEYGILYGPVTFLIYRVPMALGAVRFGWFQLWSALAILGMLLLLFLTARRSAGDKHRALRSLCAVAYVALYIGITGWFAWAVRTDPWILLCFAVALFAATRLRPAVADAVIAVAGGAAIGMKVVLLLPVLLPFALLWERDGRTWRRRAAGPALMLVLAALPFTLPGVSLANYRHELLLAGRHGFAAVQLRTNVQVVLLNLMLPLLVSLWAAHVWNREAARHWFRRRLPLLLLLGLSAVLLGITGAKNGAGAWHLMPLSLPAALLMVELWTMLRGDRDRTTVARAFAPAVWIFAVFFLRGMVNLKATVDMRQHDTPGTAALNYGDVQADLLRLVAAHPGERIAMGVSGRAEYDLTWTRHVLLLKGEPLLLDPNTRNENDAAGEPYSPALLQAVADCRVTLWLIPRGAAPFSMPSPYAYGDAVPPANVQRHPELFPAPFPQTFLAHYHPVPSTSPYFELWACNTGQHPAATEVAHEEAPPQQ